MHSLVVRETTNVAPNASGSLSKGICPYTPFIPLQYLEKCLVVLSQAEVPAIEPVQMRHMLGEHQLDLSLCAPEKILENKRQMIRKKKDSLLYRYIERTGANKMEAYRYMEGVCLFEDFQRFSNYNTAINNNTREMHEAFGEWKTTAYRLRSCSGTVGNFHITTYTEGLTELVFHILPVILPENLHYQRLHTLLYGTVDLAHVIFLVNEELEDTSFPIKGLRSMYIGRLKKIMLQTSGQIALVPKGFIEENCFVNPFKLTARKPVQRKKEKDSIVRMFLRSARHQDAFLEWSLYYDPLEEVPLPLPYDGPLVPSVESTSMVEERIAELMPQGRATVSASAEIAQVQTLAHAVEQMRQEMMDTTVLLPGGWVSNDQ